MKAAAVTDHHKHHWMNTMNRIVVAAGVALTLSACGSEPPGHTSPDLAAVDVAVTGSWTGPSGATHPARVTPAQEAEVATRMSGTVDRIAVEVGDRVASGALLASLDATDVEARIESARAQLELAQRTFDRIRNLERDGAASPQELDQARARLGSARAAVREAESQADYVEIRAPFAGTVTARMADPGDLAAPGAPLLQLASHRVKVVAELPADLMGTLSVGQDVLLESGSRRTGGTVRNVVPALDRSSRRFQVEVAPRDPSGLVPGAFVRLTMPGGAASTRWIPSDAVVRHGQLTGVFTVEEGTLRLRWIRLGRAHDGAVEVLSGPAGEMTVVRSPSAGLRDGQPVSEATRAPAPGSVTPEDGSASIDTGEEG